MAEERVSGRACRERRGSLEKVWRTSPSSGTCASRSRRYAWSGLDAAEERKKKGKKKKEEEGATAAAPRWPSIGAVASWKSMLSRWHARLSTSEGMVRATMLSAGMCEPNAELARWLPTDSSRRQSGLKPRSSRSRSGQGEGRDLGRDEGGAYGLNYCSGRRT